MHQDLPDSPDFVSENFPDLPAGETDSKKYPDHQWKKRMHQIPDLLRNL